MNSLLDSLLDSLLESSLLRIYFKQLAAIQLDSPRDMRLARRAASGCGL